MTLTREQIKSASTRERDAMIAEQLMGWTNIHLFSYEVIEDWVGLSPKVDPDCPLYVPHFSTRDNVVRLMSAKLKARQLLRSMVRYLLELLDPKGEMTHGESMDALLDASPELQVEAALYALAEQEKEEGK